MPILIVAATEAEIEPLMKAWGGRLDFLVTGVGMTATAFALGGHLAGRSYDLAINLGLAGSFGRGLELGAVVEVRRDRLAELGAEDDENFLSLASMGFGETAFEPTANLADLPGGFHLPGVQSITVNTVHGNTASIRKIQDRLDPQLESMEGAAFFYACGKMNVPCLQIRAVSNYVEKRNRAAWQIGPAIENLNKFAMDLAEKLTASPS